MTVRHSRLIGSPALYLFLLVIVGLYWLAPHSTYSRVWQHKSPSLDSLWSDSRHDQGSEDHSLDQSSEKLPDTAAKAPSVRPVTIHADQFTNSLPAHTSHSLSELPGTTDLASQQTSESSQGPLEHPIKQMHDRAVERYNDMIKRQSRTLGEAVAEYVKRYKRQPPPGFDKWFEFAVEHKSAIIDDFDMIDENLAPYWKVGPMNLRELVVSAASGPMLYNFSLKDGKFHHDREDWMGMRIAETVASVAKHIPDFAMLLNPLDEPRILLQEGAEQSGKVIWKDDSGGSSYAKSIVPCEGQSETTKHQSKSITLQTHGIPFISDMSKAQDVCRNPHFGVQHGFFIAPTSFITTHSPVPILSQTIPSTFSDIIYPSMWYWDHTMHDLEDMDMPWEDKRNKMYWAGSTTGGYQRAQRDDEPAFESHRHRFIRMTKQIGEATYRYLTRSKDGGSWVKYESEEIMSQLYNTKFTKLVQCDGEHCDKIKETYQFEAPEKASVGFGNKFLMDLDGNSFSGRFYNFLASNSCPMKQTIFREWHDERIVPWVHYIPISVSLEELPEAMRYLTLTTEGNQIAKDVARLGKEWNAKVLRREDAAIYLFRLFLEYARVISDKRTTLNFDLEAVMAAKAQAGSSSAVAKVAEDAATDGEAGKRVQ